VGWSKAAVHRIWQKYGLQPHRIETFKFSRDPQFDSNLPTSWGFISARRNLRWCCAWMKKSQIQALKRASPMWPGLPTRMTHDYTRHGPPSLFSALELTSGKVHGRCFKLHTHIEFIAFLESLARHYSTLELHLICDNYGTYKQSSGDPVACRAPTFPSAFHTDQRFLAQPGRALIRADYGQRNPLRQLRQCRPLGESHHVLAATMERQRPAISLDQVRHLHQTQHQPCCTYLRDITPSLWTASLLRPSLIAIIRELDYERSGYAPGPQGSQAQLPATC
jgi:hypothetical protein